MILAAIFFNILKKSCLDLVRISSQFPYFGGYLLESTLSWSRWIDSWHCFLILNIIVEWHPLLLLISVLQGKNANYFIMNFKISFKWGKISAITLEIKKSYFGHAIWNQKSDFSVSLCPFLRSFYDGFLFSKIACLIPCGVTVLIRPDLFHCHIQTYSDLTFRKESWDFSEYVVLLLL